MKLVQLLPVGEIDQALLRELTEAIPRCLQVSCEILPNSLDPAPAFHPERQQYHSSELLQRMQEAVESTSWRVLGVASADLYIPILKYVFGEAQIGGPCAVVSYFRLRQEFYGLPPDGQLLRERLTKEAVHELGHTFGLRHCEDYRCAMASAHAVEWIDLRDTKPCEVCRAQATWNCGEAVQNPLSATRP
ncbi:MAG TPA: archaemetzincin [Candidatus Aquilonibacter sp.]|nr:archaemetzincin [Candidatus Aquilonibacter sp.]